MMDFFLVCATYTVNFTNWSDRYYTFSNKNSASAASVRLSTNMATSSWVITGSFSCSTQDHIKLHRMKGSFSPHILSQAPSREFSSF